MLSKMLFYTSSTASGPPCAKGANPPQAVWNLTIGEDGITANAVHFFRVVVGANPYQSEKTPCEARRIFVGTGVSTVRIARSTRLSKAISLLL